MSSKGEDVEEVLAYVEQFVHGVTGGEKAVLEARLSKYTTVELLWSSKGGRPKQLLTISIDHFMWFSKFNPAFS